MKVPAIAVVGSINLDMSITVPRLPQGGETLIGRNLVTSPGGKGANQAVAAARAGGARTSLIGAVGTDPAGDSLRAGIAREGIDCTALTAVDGPSGTALITIDAVGANTIVVAPAANNHVQIGPAARAVLQQADILLGQLEVPQVVLAQAATARRPGALFVLNAAPSAPLEPALEQQVQVLVVNEYEATDLSGAPDLTRALTALSQRFPVVVVTRGAAGALVCQQGRPTLSVPAPKVAAVDTVAAGDTFCGVFATALARKLTYEHASQLACAAASLSVERHGAQASVPTADEVRARHAQTYGRHR